MSESLKVLQGGRLSWRSRQGQQRAVLWFYL